MIRTFIFLFRIGCLGLLLCPGLQAANQPNIIFILADDLGFGEVGFNGQNKILTPNIDHMAKAGMVLNHFYAGAPVCGPSRATLLYGQHTGHAPIRGNPTWTVDEEKPEIAADANLLPRELKRAGYATAFFGKWGMNEVITNPETGEGTGHPLNQGFDEFVGFNTHVEAHYHWPDYVWDGKTKLDLSGGEEKGNWINRTTYADDLFTQKALEFIDRKADETQPFFVFLSLTAPHLGYTAPAESKKPYENLGWPTSEANYRHFEMDANSHETYAAMITRMDDHLGKLFAQLRKKGIEENTLVLFTSDNGPKWADDFFRSSGPFRGGKRSVTEGGLRMPTAVVWPGVVQANTTDDTPLAFWDLLPTFCDLAGVKPSAETDGISFVPALKGDPTHQKNHELLYWEFNEREGPLQAIRFGPYKAIRCWDLEQSRMGPIQVYDLRNDPFEIDDLAASMPELAQRSLKLMEGARTENPIWPLEIRDWALKNPLKK